MRYILPWKARIAILLLLLFAGTSGAQVLSTAGSSAPSISYQAQITGRDGKPISGEHTVMITIYTDASGTQSIWSSTTKPTIADGGILNATIGSADNPLPPATELDRPLFIGVSIDGAPEMTRTALSSVPSALNVADNAITTNKLARNAVTADKIGADYVGSISVNGERVTNKGSELNIVTGDGIRSTYVSSSNSLVLSGSVGGIDGQVETHNGTSDYWGETGNNGTTPGPNYLGTSDNVALEIHVNNSGGATGGNQRVMTYIPNATSADILGGFNGNSHGATVVGAVIAGGGQNTQTNSVVSDFGFIGGGAGNKIDGTGASSGENDFGVVAGGQFNVITYHTWDDGNPSTEGTYWNFIGGGLRDSIIVDINGSTQNGWMGAATLVGGQDNLLSGPWGFIGGGSSNVISNTIPKVDDDAGDKMTWDAIVGGQGNRIRDSVNHSFIGGGLSNSISGLAAPVNNSTIGGGNTNSITNSGATIGGGWLNTATGHLSGILGGDSNIAAGATSAVGGGEINKAYGDNSVIAGGRWNVTGTPVGQGEGTFVGGGWQDTAIDRWSGTVAGTQLQTTGEAQVVMGWKNVRAGSSHVLTGGPNNDRILEIGSPRFNGPDWNPLNAFEVSYNGHSIVYDVNGPMVPGRPVIQGATYVESPVYAWGEIDATGVPVGNANFGISSVSFLPPNIYKITMNPISPYGGPLPDIREASITVTVVNNDTSDLGPFFAQEADAAAETASPGIATESVPDSLVRALLGDSPVASGSRQTTRGVVQAMPLAPTASCGYATASQIGVKTAQPRTFYIRTYTGTVSGCEGQPLPFFFKVCHR